MAEREPLPGADIRWLYKRRGGLLATQSENSPEEVDPGQDGYVLVTDMSARQGVRWVPPASGGETLYPVRRVEVSGNDVPMVEGDRVIVVTKVTGDGSVRLPAVRGRNGFMVMVKNSDPDNCVRVKGHADEAIDDSPHDVYPSYCSTLVSDGSGWVAVD